MIISRTPFRIRFASDKMKAQADVNVIVSGRNCGCVEDEPCVLEHLVSRCLRQQVENA